MKRKIIYYRLKIFYLIILLIILIPYKAWYAIDKIAKLFNNNVKILFR